MNQAEPEVIAFGIPTLDELFGRDNPQPGGGPDGEWGMRLENPEESSSICIRGPDGTGKSVLALHLAATYRARAKGHPKIIYASTDLSKERAQKVWTAFHLADPEGRWKLVQRQPHSRSFHRPVFRNWSGATRRILLSPFRPYGSTDPEKGSRFIIDYLIDADGAERDNIAFLDLESSTAGDDWGLISRIIASSGTPCPEHSRHMLIIDAVEGLETLIGERDAFGQSRTRRSRIAQVIRKAEKKYHIVFVIEEDRQGERLPEEFVADVVVRLRAAADRDYVRRTIEIEKARSQHHVRGQHNLTIRDGQGSRGPGGGENADDPVIGAPDGDGHRSYFYIYHSVNYVSRELPRLDHPGAPEPGAPDEAAPHAEAAPHVFGIKFLDNMIISKPQGVSLAGTLTALIGDDATHKSRLGRAFLSQCYRSEPLKGVAILITSHQVPAGAGEDKGDPIRPLLAAHLYGDGERGRAKVDEWMKQSLVIHRRLDIHYLNSAMFFQIIRQCVEKAQHHLLGDRIATCPRRVRVGVGERIRLVIDDWSTIQSTYPEVAKDPLFLPFLVQYLARERITALIIDTQPGSPKQTILEEQERELRALANHHFYTWHVSFFGESRVAITVLPPVSDDLPVVIRELRPLRKVDGTAADERLIVDPHFEVYQGLEGDDPSLVPLLVQLFTPTEASCKYVREMNDLFETLFLGREGRPIVVGQDAEYYERLRDFGNMQNYSHFPYTLVFQIDEFWSESRTELRRMGPYLEQDVVQADERGVVFDDPFSFFLPDREHRERRRLRHQQFDIPGYVPDPSRYPDSAGLTCEKVPYYWDFGFMLAREHVWRAAGEDRVYPEPQHSKYPTKSIYTNKQWLKVKHVWYKLTPYLPDRPDEPDMPVDPTEREKIRQDLEEHPDWTVTWRDFLGACSRVALVQSQRDGNRPDPFDIDLQAEENISCLLLEMWASEVYKRNGREISELPAEEQPFKAPRNQEKFGPSLDELLRDYRDELYAVCILLNEVVNPSHYPLDDLSFRRRSARHEAVASRHWFSTACPFVAGQDAGNPFIPMGLPGTFSARGDWFLAVARGSRSPRLAERAIDLLCSRRGNVTRIQSGLGLPVRRFPPEKSGDGRREFWTPLSHFGADGLGPRETVRYNDLLHLGAAEYDLRLMSSMEDVGGLPTEGELLVVVAVVKDVLHFRIFERHGRMVVDTDQTKLPTQAGLITGLRKQLEGLWPPHEPDGTEKERLIAAVASIVDHTRFHWLWRSMISNYDRNARIWKKWLTLALKSASDWLPTRDQFARYDVYEATAKGDWPARRPEVWPEKHYRKFEQMCLNLEYTLRRASIEHKEHKSRQ